jgi:hypothetical protein
MIVDNLLHPATGGTASAIAPSHRLIEINGYAGRREPVIIVDNIICPVAN